MTPVQRRATADAISGVVALIVFLLCVLGIGAAHGWNFDDADAGTEQTETKTVTTAESMETETTEYTAGTGNSPVPADSVKTTTKPATTQTTTTVSPVPIDDSLVGRAFQSPAVFVIFEFLLAALAAFIAAAATQRVILGSYGLKIGTFELVGIDPVTQEEVADVITEGDVSVLDEAVWPSWATLPPELFGNDRLSVIDRRSVLEIALRRAAGENGIQSDDLGYIVKRLRVVAALPDPVARSGLELLKIGDRVASGATMSPKVAKILLVAFAATIGTLLPMTGDRAPAPAAPGTMG